MTFTTKSILLSSHQAGVRAMIPGVSASLRPHPSNSLNMFKELTAAELAKLKLSARLMGETKLGTTNAATLVDSLNEVATSEIPGWVTVLGGIGAPTAWMGVTFDVLVQVLNGAGADKRIAASNLAGRVNEGTRLYAVQFVTTDSTPTFGFSYLVSSNLNGTTYHHGLITVLADIRIVG